MILDLDSILIFGKYKNRKIHDVIVVDPEYVDWLIGNYEPLLINPDFIEKSIKTNPYFTISTENLLKLDQKIFQYKINFKENFQKLNFDDFLNNQEYKKWLNISDHQKKIYEKNYLKNLDNFIEDELKR